jgi:membrane protease YdiL (CAAX protease family)
LSVAWLIIGISLYARLAASVASGRGKVNVSALGPGDVGLCTGFLVWFGANIATGFGGPARDVTQKDLVNGAVLYVVIVFLVCAFLWYRNIDPAQQFGLRRLNPVLCALMGVGLLIAVYPLVMLASQAGQHLLGGKVEPQNIVKFFVDASKGSDKLAVYMTMALGVVVAPIAEETIFRGYIYGTLKRYIGAGAAALISAGVFAAVHLNSSSLGGLFVLALAFTLAYEATGCLLVNICMHATFNLVNFLLMLWLPNHLTT